MWWQCLKSAGCGMVHMQTAGSHVAGPMHSHPDLVRILTSMQLHSSVLCYKHKCMRMAGIVNLVKCHCISHQC